MPSNITGRIGGTNITGRSRINTQSVSVLSPLEVLTEAFNSQTVSILKGTVNNRNCYTDY